MNRKKTYTAAEVASVLDSVLESLAGNILVVKHDTQEESLSDESLCFSLGQLSGLEVAEQLIEDTKGEL